MKKLESLEDSEDLARTLTRVGCGCGCLGIVLFFLWAVTSSMF